jgi:hypothetical protein
MGDSTDRGETERAPAAERVPSLGEIAPVYDRLLALADSLLSGPVTTRVRSWQDGEFEVRVWHKYGSPDRDGHRKEVLRYHSREASVTGAVLDVDSAGEETVLWADEIGADGTGTGAETIRERAARGR